MAFVLAVRVASAPERAIAQPKISKACARGEIERFQYFAPGGLGGFAALHQTGTTVYTLCATAAGASPSALRRTAYSWFRPNG
jgi:hypothetical protein